MNRKEISKVREEARRVVSLCADAEQELKALDWGFYIGGTKTSGALRRASMDLTRALAEMRKP